MRTLIIALGMLLLAGATNADDAADPYARDLLILTDWFEGEFDNEEQRWFEADPRSATPEEDRVIRVHTIHQRIVAPTLGEHVFYVEEYRNDDTSDVFRQRIVIFTSAPAEGGIRMQQGFFNDADSVLGGHNDLTKLEGLSADDVFFMNQCDVYWRRKAEQFEGSMRPRACVFGEGDVRRYSVHDLTLSENMYWRVDSTFLVSDDSLHAGHPVDQPLQYRRVKPFVCQGFFYADNAAPQIINDIPLHSQGGMATMVRDSDGAAFDILMRDKEYPYYDTRPDFIYFSIRRNGERRSIAFSVNDPESRQFGIRTPEVGAFCHREGYKFRESIDTLQ